MSKVISIGSYLIRKKSPESLTLFQLAQAEDEGLWSDRPIMESPAELIDFQDVRHNIYHDFMQKWTQIRHSQ